MVVLIIGALFDDPTHQSDSRSDSPQCCYQHGDDPRLLLFGAGERACIAKHHVLEILVSALAGLLTLPNIRWAIRGSVALSTTALRYRAYD